MKRLPIRVALSLGLSSLVVMTLLLALWAGLIPDRDAAQRQARRSLAEAVAVGSTVLLGDESDERLRLMLDFIRQRNEALRSIALRTADGVVRIAVGEHPADFVDRSADGSTETHVRLPLLDGQGVWGHAELHFAPLRAEGLAGWIGRPVLLIGAVGACSFGLFMVFLARALRQLDPKRAVPGRVRTAFDTMAEGLLVLDPKAQIVLANQAFATVMNTSPESLMGRPVSELQWSQPLRDGEAPLHWQSVARGNAGHRNVLMYLQPPGGERRSFMVNVSPVPGAGGKVAGLLVSLDDVTDLERKEIELRLARDAAESANRAKSDFLANMSHEIRTPMNAILGFAELLRRGWQRNGSDTQRHLDTILGSGRHLLALINDILDLSKVEAGRLEVERIDCAVHEVINEVATIMRVRADEKGEALQVEYPQRLPAHISTDAARLRQIVTNLVGNALKFTATGAVTIRVQLLAGGDAPPQLAIDVQDTGIGIPTDKLEAIFEPFVQAEASTTRQYGGTGLGLAISRRFAQALGGDIVASSEPGKGSTFHVRLDAGTLDGVAWLEPAELGRVAAAPRAADEPRWCFDGQRVLVVDDGAENRELVRLVLEGAGLTVAEATDGAQAIERVAALAPALVLMDMQMPVMDGATATRRLRDAGCQLPIIALTANAMKGFEDQLQAAGFSGFLTKPVDIDLLLENLATLLGGRRAERSTTADTTSALPAPSAAMETAEPMPSPATGDGGSPATGEPIVSRLAHHPRLAKVARSFCQALPAKLQAMGDALAAQRFHELAELAHWLKGSGGTVGYDALFEPARELELHARSQRFEMAQRSLAEIVALASRLVPPPDLTAAPAAPRDTNADAAPLPAPVATDSIGA